MCWLCCWLFHHAVNACSILCVADLCVCSMIAHLCIYMTQFCSWFQDRVLLSFLQNQYYLCVGYATFRLYVIAFFVLKWWSCVFDVCDCLDVLPLHVCVWFVNGKLWCCTIAFDNLTLMFVVNGFVLVSACCFLTFYYCLGVLCFVVMCVILLCLVILPCFA